MPIQPKAPQRVFAHHGKGREWLTIAEVADEARCNWYTVRRAIERGDLKASTPEGTRLIRIERKNADAWLRGEPAHEVPAATAGP